MPRWPRCAPREWSSSRRWRNRDSDCLPGFASRAEANSASISPGIQLRTVWPAQPPGEPGVQGHAGRRRCHRRKNPPDSRRNGLARLAANRVHLPPPDAVNPDNVVGENNDERYRQPRCGRAGRMDKMVALIRHPPIAGAASSRAKSRSSAVWSGANTCPWSPAGAGAHPVVRVHGPRGIQRAGKWALRSSESGRSSLR